MIIFGSFLPSLLVGLHLQSLLGPGSRHCYGIITLTTAIAGVNDGHLRMAPAHNHLFVGRDGLDVPTAPIEALANATLKGILGNLGSVDPTPSAHRSESLSPFPISLSAEEKAGEGVK